VKNEKNIYKIWNKRYDVTLFWRFKWNVEIIDYAFISKILNQLYFEDN